MKKYIDKANTLIEALPYIQQFYGTTVVVKYGGAAMVKERLKKNFALDVVLMKFVGINPVVVHGGGPQIGEYLAKLGKETKFIDGLRVTDKETLDIVEMVLVGKVNTEIVNLFNRAGGHAVGLSGKDDDLIVAKKYTGSNKNAKGVWGAVDYGHVGEVKRINPGVLETLDKKFIPVVAPIGACEQGHTYNINADLVAAEIAVALNAEKLILLTDVEGVQNRGGDLLSSLTAKDAKKLIANKTIEGGMIPKVKCCLDAIKKGVHKAHIINGNLDHSLILEIFTESGIGTQMLP